MTTKYDFSFGFTSDFSGFFNMEIDRIYGESKLPPGPIVRFYTWKKRTISIGLNQNPLKRLNVERCLADGIEIVARPTGGREILHGWDLCCSVIWPTKIPFGVINSADLFESINEILRSGLERMGIQAKCHAVSDRSGVKDGPCFSQIDRGEISIFGKKIIASAQRIYERSILQQSSISISRPNYDIADYLRTRLFSEKGNRIVNSGAYMEEVLEESFSIPEIIEVFKEAFESEIGKSRDLVLAKFLKRNHE